MFKKHKRKTVRDVFKTQKAPKLKVKHSKKVKPHLSFKERISRARHSISGTFARLSIGNHRVMEHKRDQFFMVVAIMIIGMAGGTFHYHNYMVKQAETLTSYASSVSFSKTSGTSIKLHKSVMSRSGKTAYVPFTFSSLDSVPNSANEYDVYVGASDANMAGPVKGTLVMFGQTGRGTIVLHSNHKIANQPLDIIVRNRQRLTAGEGDEESNQPDSNNDGSIQTFEQKYDALDFKVNPGSSKVKRKSGLGTHDSLESVYNVLYAKHDLKKIAESDKKNKAQIKDNALRVRVFTKRLKALGFRFPKQPAWMSPKWKPYNAMRPDGVPRNKPNSKENIHIANTDLNNPLTNISEDYEDPQQLPDHLTKKDGTTTDDESQNHVSSQGQNDSGSEAGSHINGGDADDPSDMWSIIKSGWENIRSAKYDIMSINAAEKFKVKAQLKLINGSTSVAKSKHFKQVN